MFINSTYKHPLNSSCGPRTPTNPHFNHKIVWGTHVNSLQTLTICMYVCMYVYAHTYIRMYVYAHTYIRMYVYAHTYIRMYVYAHTYIHIDTKM